MYTMCTSLLQACTNLCLSKAQTLASRPGTLHNLVPIQNAQSFASLGPLQCLLPSFLLFTFNNQLCLCRLAFIGTLGRFSTDSIRYFFSMSYNFNSNINLTIPEQICLFFLRCHSKQAHLVLFRG